MSTGKLYQEAINEANDLVKMAEERARDKLIESVMPRIRDLLEKRILEADDLGDDEDDIDDLLFSGGDDDEEVGDEVEGSDDLEMQEPQDMGQEELIQPDPVSSPVQDLSSAAPSAGSEELTIGVPSSVKKVSFTVSESSKKSDKLVKLDESNIQDLIKLIDGRGTLVERAKSIQLELKTLRKGLDALSGRGKQLRAGGQLVEEFNAILRKSIGLKQEIKDSVPGPLAESAKLEFNKLEKEIVEMSTKTLLRSLLSEGNKKKLTEMYEEAAAGHDAGEEFDFDVDADDAGDEDPVSAEEPASPAGVDVDKAQEAATALIQALGGTVEFGDADEEDEEGEEDEEEDEETLDEGETIYEIDESMLRRELGRLRALRESAKNAATEMADAFGDGVAGKDAFTNPPELNKFDDGSKEETVKESRRNRELTAKLNEAAKAIKALDRQLAEQKLFNAKLLYVNKLMQSSSLTDKQFRSIVEALDSAKNLREAHLLYTSLHESLAKSGRSLSESARTVGGSSRPVGKASSSTSLNEGAVVDRWALLAGINK